MHPPRIPPFCGCTTRRRHTAATTTSDRLNSLCFLYWPQDRQSERRPKRKKQTMDRRTDINIHRQSIYTMDRQSRTTARPATLQGRHLYTYLPIPKGNTHGTPTTLRTNPRRVHFRSDLPTNRSRKRQPSRTQTENQPKRKPQDEPFARRTKTDIEHKSTHQGRSQSNSEQLQIASVSRHPENSDARPHPTQSFRECSTPTPA